MVQIQIDDVYDMFAEIDLMRHNGWKEVQLEVSFPLIQEYWELYKYVNSRQKKVVIAGLITSI